MSADAVMTENELLMLWLDGYSSGIASTVQNFSPSSTDELTHAIARRAVACILGDPLAVDVILTAVRERASGQVPETRNFTAHGLCGGQS